MNHIGVHIDNNNYDTVLNALKIAHSIGAHVLQIYAGSKILTTLREKYIFTNSEALSIKKFLKETGMRLYIHTILRINFCKDPKYPRYKWMIDNITHDMKQCKKIGGSGIVIHCGSYKTKTVNLNYDTCMIHFKMAIKILLENCKGVNIIIETPVNRQYSVGGNIQDLYKLYSIFKNKINFCIDTQHIFASGYDVKEYFIEFNKIIGFKNLKLIHLNDSDKEYGSLVNRHISIGKGYLFEKGNAKSLSILKYVLEVSLLNKIDMVMETDFNGYKKDIKYLVSLIKSINNTNTNTNKINKKGGSIKKNIKPLILKIFGTLLINYKNKKNTNMIIRYKIDSYEKAIKSIEKFEGPIYSSSDLKDIEYIGKGMIEKIDEIANTGTLKAYNEIKNNKYIDAYKVFSELWGFGDTVVKEILSKKIYTISQLKQCEKKGEIILTIQQKIGLKYYKELNKKIPREKITIITNKLNKLLKDNNIESHLYNAGSYRSGAKMCGDIDLIITCKTNKDLKLIPNIFRDILISEKMLEETLLSGEKKSIYIIKPEYFKIDIAYILEKQLPWYLLYFGSSREFSKKIRILASKKGFKLNEKGLFDKNTGKLINFHPKSEKDIFNFLEIEYVEEKNRF